MVSMAEARVISVLDSPKSTRKSSPSPRPKTRSKSVDSPGPSTTSNAYLSHSSSDISSPKSTRRPLLGKKRGIMEIDVEMVRSAMSSIRIDVNSPSEMPKKIKHGPDFTDPLNTPKSILRKAHAPATVSTKNQVHFESPSKTTPPSARLECTNVMSAQGGSRTPRRLITPRRRLNPSRDISKLFYQDANSP